MRTIKNFSEFIKIVLNLNLTYKQLNDMFIWRDNDDLNKATYYMYISEGYDKKRGLFNVWSYYDLKNNIVVIAEENKKGIFEITKIEKNIHKF